MTKCNNCNTREGEYTFLDTDNMEYQVMCLDCYDNKFYEIADMGVSTFMDWAIANYGIKRAYSLAIQLYGEERVEQYKENIGGADEEMLTMFTYGILKYSYNIKREGGTDIVENCTVTGHKMYLYNYSFPVTEFTDLVQDKVYGTLFKVPKSIVLYSYDITEGYDPKRPKYQNMYNRELVTVTTPTGEKVEANMYIANPIMFRRDFTPSNYVPTGNFDDTAKKRAKAKAWKGGK